MIFGVLCLLAQETFTICDLNMFNFRPYFSLNVFSNLRDHTYLAKENFAFGELKCLISDPF